MRVIEHLVKTLRNSAIFNPEVQVTPSCILWPDKDRQWEAVIPRLQSELAELLVLAGSLAAEGQDRGLERVAQRALALDRDVLDVAQILHAEIRGREDRKSVV